MNKPKFKIGQEVILNYNVLRYGIILDVDKRKNCNPLYRVRCLKDRTYKDYKRPFDISCDEAWIRLPTSESGRY